MANKTDSMQIDSSPHASLGNDEADQAGPFFSAGTTETIAQAQTTALRELQTLGYYRFRIYWLTLLQDGKTNNEVQFSQVLEAMHFDEELTNLILGLIGPVEVAFRSALATALIGADGEYAIYNSDLFKSETDYARTMSILQSDYKRSNRNDCCPLPHTSETVEKPPTWLLLEIGTLGTLSKMYGNLAVSTARQAAASSFGIKPCRLGNWMRCMTILRNICAHNGWLHGRTFNVKPALYKEHSNIDQTHLFAYLLPLVKLYENIRPSQSNDAKLRLKHIVESHPDVDLTRLGFPENWMELLGIPAKATTGGRARGRQGGRPPKNPDAIEKALYLYDLKTLSIAEISRETGVGPTTLYKYINLRSNSEE